MYKYLKSFLVPTIAVILGLLVGAIIMFIGGYDPVQGYQTLFTSIFGDIYNAGEIVRRATPLILAGLAVAFAFKSGLFNIGVEGQFIMGMVAAAWIGTSFQLPMVIHLPLAIIGAAIAGAAWGFIPGFLKAKLRVHEVVVTIMMNYIALKTAAYLVGNVLTANKERTENIYDSAKLVSEPFRKLTEFSTMHNGIFVALVAVVLIWFLIDRTTKGYEFRAVGLNQYASQYAGMNVNRNIIYSMMISGALAGIAGSMEVLGGFGYLAKPTSFTGVGFDGIAVALLGANNPFGILLAAFLFAGLKVGGGDYNFTKIAPTEIISVVIAIIIFFVAINYIIRYLLDKFDKREAN